MPLLVPLLRFQPLHHGLRVIVIHSHNVVLPSGGEMLSFRVVVYCQSPIGLFDYSVDLLARATDDLLDGSVAVGR